MAQRPHNERVAVFAAQTPRNRLLQKGRSLLQKPVSSNLPRDGRASLGWLVRTIACIGLLSLWSSLYAKPDPTPEPLYSPYFAEAAERLFWREHAQTSLSSISSDMEQAKIVLDDRLQTEENRYLAATTYVNFLIDSARLAEAHVICERYPPKADHLEYQASCVHVSPLPLMEIARQMEAIGDTAYKLHPKRLSAQYIYNAVGGMLSFKGHFHEAIRLYKKVFESLPADAEEEIVQAKLNLASAYATPMVSESWQRLSPRYYQEVLDWYLRQKQTPYVVSQIKFISYNKSIAHLFLFNEFDQAIKNLDLADGYVDLSADIKVFKAYALARSHHAAEAREQLTAIPWDKAFDPERIAFLHCYVDLTQRILGDPVSIQSCLTLKSPQVDVLLDLTGTLSQISLRPEEENQMWRNFYTFFTKHMKPDFQESLATASNEAELQQEKAESRLKDLKLKNMSLYQDLSYALIGIAAVCAIALFLAIRSWRSSRRHASEMSAEKARLQYIIDSIEEGLVRVNAGLKLEPEESPHLLAITGGQTLKEASLAQLLALTDLAEDAQVITCQCLAASIGEPSLSFELNQPNLPTEVKIQDRIIAFYWQALIDQDRVQSILLVMRNITALHELERVSKKAREDADRKLEYAREILACHPRAVSQFLSELPRLIQHASFACLQSSDWQGARRIIHTIKGTARTLGLLDLQNQAHWVEDCMLQQNITELPLLLEELHTFAETYQSAMQHVLGNISEMDVRSIFELVAHQKPALERQLAAADITLGNLLVDESTTLTMKELQPLAEVVLHALTNAADHGFILPKRQGHTLPDPRFAVSVFQRGDHRLLILRDNGIGIDHQKIMKQAQARGWQPNDNQLWTDFLLLDGVTTAEALSMTSGRGVGMSAIQTAAAKLGGRVQLLDNDQGQGSMLKITWPIAREAAA